MLKDWFTAGFLEEAVAWNGSGTLSTDGDVAANGSIDLLAIQQHASDWIPDYAIL